MANDGATPQPTESTVENQAHQPSAAIDSSKFDPYRENAQPAQRVSDAAAEKHLTKLELEEQKTQPFNPRKISGQYDQDDVAYAKQHFDPLEVLQLEEKGPHDFNKVIEAARDRAGKGWPHESDVIKFGKNMLKSERPAFFQKYFPDEKP